MYYVEIVNCVDVKVGLYFDHMIMLNDSFEERYSDSRSVPIMKYLSHLSCCVSKLK